MNRNKKMPLSEEIEEVFNTLEEFIMENHSLCSLADIADGANLSKKRCKNILAILEKEKRIQAIYKRKGESTLYIPKYMLEEILNLQLKPRWMKNYIFTEKEQYSNRIKEFKEKIQKFEMIERLLYATGIPLEESVAFCLDTIGFENVIHHRDEDHYDISFKFKDVTYLIEVEGTIKQGNKKKINQLSGWMQKAIISENLDPKRLNGIFIINHFRKLDPDTRGKPLTQHAEKFLALFYLKFFTTKFLFDIIKDVLEEKITKEVARGKIIEGEIINE
ncbi:MAG: FaeA/PapI family transcriptional regulator [Promethearchaeota archaeon]